jgi:hypothetical protein
VYIDYNPWDTGTRREDKADLDAVVEMVKALNVDGVFLDTMQKGPAEFRAKLDAARPGVVLEGEAALPLERLHDHHASWAQGFDDSAVPGVLRDKWIERRHMQHQIRRWQFDHTSELHAAWMNGSGMMVWENVFGSWVGWNPRDRALLRAMLPVQRRFFAIFTGEGWTPLVPTLQQGVYASLWESEGLRLWTLVNRTDKAVEGPLLIAATPGGERSFDLVAGRELPNVAASGTFTGRISPRGIGCFLAAAPGKLGEDFSAFLERQAATNDRASLDVASPTTETRLLAVPPTRSVAWVPKGMVELPAATLDLTIEIRKRECGFYEGSYFKDEQFRGMVRHYLESKTSSAQFSIHAIRRRATFSRFAMDKTPVTNAQFAEYLGASGYRPRHSQNFLKHWVDGKPPAGKERHPVVYVDLDDARAYAKWVGMRLPTEEEWQYAAQGTDGRTWPWGAKMEDARCNDGKSGGTTPVDAFPRGRSPYGCLDLCGNVWQWTESERSDGHTRFVMIRGGSYFEAQGSGWYVSGGPRPASFATKFLLMWPGLDRCATIGFRCVVDLES